MEGPAWAGPRLQSLGEGYPQGDAEVLLGSRAGCSLLRPEKPCIPGKPATLVLWQSVIAAASTWWWK